MDNANILNPEQASRHKDKTSCVIMDRWSVWYVAYPAPDLTTGTIVQNLHHFAADDKRSTSCSLAMLGATSTLQDSMALFTGVVAQTVRSQMVLPNGLSDPSLKDLDMSCFRMDFRIVIWQGQQHALPSPKKFTAKCVTPSKMLTSHVSDISSKVSKFPSVHWCVTFRRRILS